MPVPGTCTFAGWRCCRTVSAGACGGGVKDIATGRFLENSQTEPDIKLMNEYDVVSKGKDQQLEAAFSRAAQGDQVGQKALD